MYRKSYWVPIARGAVPDYEDAVYHPAMTSLKWTAALEALLDAEALANLMRRRWRMSALNLSPTNTFVGSYKRARWPSVTISTDAAPSGGVFLWRSMR